MQYEPIKRNRYSEPPFTEGDFSARNFDEDFNEFHLPLNRMQLANFQEWGVAQGLEVSGSIGGTTLTIAPGVAVDIRGQLISLSLEGKGDIGSNPPRGEHEEVDVPVELKELSGSDQAEDTAYFVTIQFSQILRFSEGPLGRYEYVPWVSLQSVEGFTDDGISVILARVVISSNGELTELQAQGRRLVGKTVQELLLRRPQVTGEQVGQVSAGKIAATENGLQISVTDTEKEVLLSQENGNSFSQLEVRAENSIFRGELKVNKDLQVGDTETPGSFSLSVAGNVSLGDADNDEVRITGVLRSGHSSGALRVNEDLSVNRSLTVDGGLYVRGYIRTAYHGLFGPSPNDLFSYDDKDMGHYSLGWFGDSWNSGGPTAWLSGYGGLKLFTGGQPRLSIKGDGNVGIGTTNPGSNKLKVEGDTEITDDLKVNGTTSTQILRVDALNRTSHVNADGAIYRKSGQVYITVDDNLYIRDSRNNNDNVAMHINTNNGNVDINGDLKCIIGGNSYTISMLKSEIDTLRRDFFRHVHFHPPLITPSALPQLT